MAMFSESIVCVSPGSKQRFDLGAFQVSFQVLHDVQTDREREGGSERERKRLEMTDHSEPHSAVPVFINHRWPSDMPPS